MTWLRLVLTAPYQWDVLLRKQVYPTESGTASQSGVGVDRGLGEERVVSIVYMADGWLLFVALSVSDVLFRLEFRSVALEWQLWAALMVDGWLSVVS